jgi:c-di-GMP-binding flagellar brake protein YcgR
MISTAESFIERRHLPRFQVHSGLFAMDSQLGQILDISMGGLAFRYVERQQPPTTDQGIGIIFDEEDLCFDHIPVQTITDAVIFDRQGKKIPSIRRCGVRFLDLSPTQRTLLQNFIWFNAAATP